MNGVGRVFFLQDGGRLKMVAYQPLENHRANVEKLLRAWQEGESGEDWAVTEATKEWLVEAVTNHDWGKNGTFSIKVKKNKRTQQDELTYSFSGHRFRIHPEIRNSYARLLERGHHDFSTEEVVSATYQLVHKESLVEAKESQFAKDLYVYEMCDQIEAELSNWVWAGQNENRAFMSFALEPAERTQHGVLSAGDGSVFYLSPFALKEAVELELEFHCYSFNFKAITKQLADELTELPTLPDEKAEVVRVRVSLVPEVANSAANSTQLDVEAYYKHSTGYNPNLMQAAVWQAVEEGKDAILLKSPTGSGKTEAATLPLLNMGKRIVVVLPSKALLDDHMERFIGILSRLSVGREYRLIVDTGDHSQLYRFIAGKTLGRKSDAQKDRHLYRGDVILTTLDKLLYRYFGYGERRKSFTFPLRLGEKQTAFIFDEAHTYDGTSYSNFTRLLEALYLRNHALVVMTATLPNSFLNAPRAEFNFSNAFEILDYTGGENKANLEAQQIKMGQKGVHIGRRRFHRLPEIEPSIVDVSALEFAERKERLDKHKEARRKALLSQFGAVWKGAERVIITVDRVKDAAWLYQQLRSESRLGLRPGREGNLLLYHGRLDAEQRKAVFARAKALDKAEQPYVLISTSAIEVGVDLDATHLLTEICLPESLVQRAGRVNRKGKLAAAEVWVLGSEIPEYLNPLSPEETAKYLSSLQTLNSESFDSDVTAKLMESYPRPILQDPRAEVAFDALARYVYEAKIEYQPLYDLGFIATRSWEPTVVVCVDTAEGWRQVDVPVGRLARGIDDAKKVRLEVFAYPEERSEKPEWTDVTRGGDLYKNTYRVILGDELAQQFDGELGFVDLPRVFQREHWPSDPPLKYRLRTYRTEEDKSNNGVFFLAEESAKKKGKSIVLSYLADPGLVEV